MARYSQFTPTLDFWPEILTSIQTEAGYQKLEQKFKSRLEFWQKFLRFISITHNLPGNPYYSGFRQNIRFGGRISTIAEEVSNSWRLFPNL